MIKEENFEIAEPKASSLIHSIRSFGYDLSTAIADIIDNSITARAKNIWIDFNWNGQDSWISIKDDGIGMNEEELINSMILGSKNPLEERAKNDLGRFGLGLKTATFSQCKKLTVITKSSNDDVYERCWDLDYITKTAQWRLLKKGSDLVNHETLNNLENGTVVIWEKLDRIIDQEVEVEDNRAHDVFLNNAAAVKKHLAMVFHRFLEGPNNIKIWFNNRLLEPWNPFAIAIQATELLTIEPLFVNRKRIEVRPYVLPHHSKLTTQEHEKLAGINGWNAHQGFYVYRNKRMLVAGDWLGLGFQKEEHYKLARILIDIPNDLDEEWSIDVKKSKARPPHNLRQDLKRIAKITRERASNIYRHRGKIVSRNIDMDFTYVWEQSLKHGKYSYQINREHTLIKSLMKNVSIKSDLSALLKLLEETIPIPTIIMNYSEQPDNLKGPFEDAPPKELITVLERNIDSLLKQGNNLNEIKQRLLHMEPFDLYPELVVSCCEAKLEV
ncbi:ATP-binding protein [Mesobacillus boroniphilus]|uniref:ATP-binding protein n=1 Tax=Mesobacillus boroniphilus TaxID=308892 RepID=A0A944CIV3_9BACI|nr:ATP-binding protein [Mesobacillus boroniphilus]MBS8263848.1 ATP-binding protein [Mesobacillus boroniphilus]